MPNQSLNDPSTDAAFSEIPFTPSQASSKRATSQIGKWIVVAMFALMAVGAVLAYQHQSRSRIDANAPRVVVEVIGMHCTIQCGLKIAAALETLPGVIPGSTTANPKTGIVTFAVSSADAVTVEEIERAIATAGFGVQSVRLPHSP